MTFSSSTSRRNLTAPELRSAFLVSLIAGSVWIGGVGYVIDDLFVFVAGPIAIMGLYIFYIAFPVLL